MEIQGFHPNSNDYISSKLGISKNLAVALIATITIGILVSVLLGEYATPTSAYIAASAFGLTSIGIACCLYKNRKIRLKSNFEHVSTPISIPNLKLNIAQNSPTTLSSESDLKAFSQTPFRTSLKPASSSLQTVTPMPIALQRVKNDSFAHKLKEILTNTFSQYVLTRQKPDPDCIWNVSILLLLQEASLDDTSCDPCIVWPDTDLRAYDHYQAQLTNTRFIYREDIINQSTCGDIDTVSIWRKLKDLTKNDVTQIRLAFESPRQEDTLELNVSEVVQGIKKIVEQLRKRYPFYIDVEMQQILYTSSCQGDFLSIAEIVNQYLKQLFLTTNTALTDITNEKDSEKICGLLVLLLLQDAKVSNSLLTLKSGWVLDFTRLGAEEDLVDLSCLKFINLFNVNELNSRNYQELPFISDEPLQLANFLKDPNIFQRLHNNIINGQPPFLGIESTSDILMAFNNFKNFLCKKFYNNFCAKLSREDARQIAIPVGGSPPSVSAPKQSLHTEIETKEREAKQRAAKPYGKVIPNDQFGDTFMTYINRRFTEGHAWSYSGSCLLSCFFPECTSDQQGYEKVSLLRAQIATHLESNIKEFLEYVTVIPNFNKLPLDEKVKLQEVYWVISTDNTVASKAAAIRNRCQEMLSARTYLADVEISIVAQILKCPIWIYKKKAEKFFIDDHGNLLPHVKYGEGYKSTPFYLLDDHDHYKPLKDKKRK